MTTTSRGLVEHFKLEKKRKNILLLNLPKSAICKKFQFCPGSPPSCSKTKKTLVKILVLKIKKISFKKIKKYHVQCLPPNSYNKNFKKKTVTIWKNFRV